MKIKMLWNTGRKNYEIQGEKEGHYIRIEYHTKEDEVIKRCVLYPYDLDLDVLEAGIASNLFKTIMKNSY